jgi:uncharacterized protein (DUF58 family)
MDQEELLKRVRTIELKTRGLTRQVFAGEYQSAFKGRGMSFSEVRDYHYGDDVRNIDWNVTARFREPFVKVFEEERELTVMLVVDLSGSMYFGQTDLSKLVTAVEAAATIAFSAAKKNDKVGAVFVTDRVERYIPAKKGTQHVYALLKSLISFEPENTGTNLDEGLKSMLSTSKQRSICFLISDFVDAAAIRDGLAAVASRHDLVALQIEDEGEHSLPDVGFVQWKNAETGATTWVDSSSPAVRREYAEKQEKRKLANEKLFRSLGIDNAVLASGKEVYLPLMELFRRRK